MSNAILEKYLNLKSALWMCHTLYEMNVENCSKNNF